MGVLKLADPFEPGPRCRKCNKGGWKDEAAAYGHEGRCKGQRSSSDTPFKGEAEAPAQAPQGPQQGLGSALPEGISNSFLEGRVEALEKELMAVKVKLKDQQLDGERPSQNPTPSPLPWIFLGGAVVLGGLWILGVFDANDEERPDQVLGGPLPTRSPHRNVFLGRKIGRAHV